MTLRLILAALLGLAIGMNLRLHEPRQLADAAEHALGWICRMTYNESSSVEGHANGDVTYPAQCSGKKSFSRAKEPLLPTEREHLAGIKPGLLSPFQMTAAAWKADTRARGGSLANVVLSQGQCRSGCKGTTHRINSRFSARPAVTFFLRMLGLPRLRTTPVELRP